MMAEWQIKDRPTNASDAWHFEPSAVYQEPYWYPAVKIKWRIAKTAEDMGVQSPMIPHGTATIIYSRQGFDLEAQAVDFANDWLNRYP